MPRKSTVEALPDAAPLRLDVLRDGEALAMNAPLQSVVLPALRMELGAATLANTDCAAESRAPPGPGVGPDRPAQGPPLAEGRQAGVPRRAPQNLRADRQREMRACPAAVTPHPDDPEHRLVERHRLSVRRHRH